jgi:hypothetical protein
MEVPEVRRAVAAATSIASALALRVDDARVLHNSNKLALRLLPCNVFARVAHVGHHVAPFEIELAQRLTDNESPEDDQYPRGLQMGRALLSAIREGPPWLAIDDLML